MIDGNECQLLRLCVLATDAVDMVHRNFQVL